MPKLSIVIPAYNEEKRLGRTLNDYGSYFLNKLGEDYEIFVVLNGCRDRTLDVVKGYSKKYPAIRYIDIKEGIGKGGALIEGFKIVNGDYIGFVDADGATNASAYYNLYEQIKDYDGIIASRWIKGAKVRVRQTAGRRIASRLFNVLVRILFGIDIVDSQCGAKLFTKKAIKNVVNELGTTRWAFDIDLLYLLKRNGFKLTEVPTEWDDQAESQLKMHRVIPEMLLAIIRLRLVYSPFYFVVDAYNKIWEMLKSLIR